MTTGGATAAGPADPRETETFYVTMYYMPPSAPNEVDDDVDMYALVEEFGKCTTLDPIPFPAGTLRKWFVAFREVMEMDLIDVVGLRPGGSDDENSAGGAVMFERGLQWASALRTLLTERTDDAEVAAAEVGLDGHFFLYTAEQFAEGLRDALSMGLASGGGEILLLVE